MREKTQKITKQQVKELITELCAAYQVPIKLVELRYPNVKNIMK